jgi:Transglycosylase-like domain
LRNHTAKSVRTVNNTSVNAGEAADHDAVNLRGPATTLGWGSFRVRRTRSSLLALSSAAGFVGLLTFSSLAPSAVAAEPAALPQAYSAKIVDTASLTTAASAPVSSAPAVAVSGSGTPVVSLLPVPSTKPDPAAPAVPKAKKKTKKVAPTTTEAPPSDQEALALPANKLKASKTSDTKAPAQAKENSSNANLDAAFAALRKCESGGNYKIATGNGYYGAYQFDPRTWRSLGYTGLPSDAPPEVQDEAARKLLAKAGWGQWPACSRKLGLR